MALVVPGGVPGHDAHVFPIIELDAKSCVIDATVPLVPGQHLGTIEIVGDRHVLRRAAANIMEIAPWCTADGSRRFRCTLRVTDAEPQSEGDLHDVVSDPLRVKRVIEFAAMSAARGSFFAPVWGRGAARFAQADRDSLTISIDPAPHGRLRPHFLQVSFPLFSVNYEVTVRVLETHGAWVTTALPLYLRRSRGLRREHELALAARPGLRVQFRNPVSGQREERAVSRFSYRNIEFAAAKQHDMLWQGLPLEHAVLRWPGNEVVLGELRVDLLVSRGAERCVQASILDGNVAYDAKLASLLTDLAHPEVSVHDGNDFRALLTIYKEAGLFAPHMRRNLDPIVPAAKGVWHSMHQTGADVVQTLVHGDPARPDAAVTAVRPWERAYMAQHFVSINAHSSEAAGRLQRAYVEHVQARPEAHYLLFFVKADNHRMNAFYERFFDTTGTPEAIERRTVQLWCRSGELGPWTDADRDAQFRVRSLRAGTAEQIVAHAAERALGVQGAAALSLLPGEFNLPDISARFAKVGLTRRRVCETLVQRSTPLYAVIEELTSPGFNFTWMLNASWVLPVHPELDEGGHALRATLRHIIRKPAQTPTGDVFVNAVEGVDAAILEEGGFVKLADVYMYTMNRAGLNRYFYYTSERYGEVDVRTQQRQQRRSGIQLRAPVGEPANADGETRKVV
ncbi:MAG TPA: hypothetical protein VF331_15695 [Polyangiales bacterium]